MKHVLMKDIVIPAGTIFDDAPLRTVRAPGAYMQTVIGLTRDTAGTFEYEVMDDNEWFQVWDE
jgi:hypothetical protein